LRRGSSDRRLDTKLSVQKFYDGTPDQKLDQKLTLQKIRQTSPDKSPRNNSPEKSLDSNLISDLCHTSSSTPQSAQPNYLAWRTPLEAEKKCPNRNEPGEETLVDILGCFQLRHYAYKSPTTQNVTKSLDPKTAVSSSFKYTAICLVEDSQSTKKKTDENRDNGNFIL